VTIQAVGEWIRTGKIGSERLPSIALALGVSIDSLFFCDSELSEIPADRIAEPSPRIYPPLTSNEVMLVKAYRRTPDDIKNARFTLVRVLPEQFPSGPDQTAG